MCCSCSGHWLDISEVSALRAGSYLEDFNLKEVLDNNSGTLRNLSLSTIISARHDLDNAFFSDTIRNLTHLRQVDIYTPGSICSHLSLMYKTFKLPQLSMVVSDICSAYWSDKTRFPAALRPVVASVALKALALDEYDEHFFNLMPSYFPITDSP